MEKDLITWKGTGGGVRIPIKYKLQNGEVKESGAVKRGKIGS